MRFLDQPRKAGIDTVYRPNYCGALRLQITDCVMSDLRHRNCYKAVRASRSQQAAESTLVPSHTDREGVKDDTHRIDRRSLWPPRTTNPGQRRRAEHSCLAVWNRTKSRVL